VAAQPLRSATMRCKSCKRCKSCNSLSDRRRQHTTNDRRTSHNHAPRYGRLLAPLLCPPAHPRTSTHPISPPGVPSARRVPLCDELRSPTSDAPISRDTVALPDYQQLAEQNLWDFMAKYPDVCYDINDSAPCDRSHSAGCLHEPPVEYRSKTHEPQGSQHEDKKQVQAGVTAATILDLPPLYILLHSQSNQDTPSCVRVAATELERHDRFQRSHRGICTVHTWMRGGMTATPLATVRLGATMEWQEMCLLGDAVTSPPFGNGNQFILMSLQVCSLLRLLCIVTGLHLFRSYVGKQTAPRYCYVLLSRWRGVAAHRRQVRG
jgi:hypothetical protein